MEIERKYLLKYMPENLENYPHILIEQGYISTNPVIRIRKKVSAESKKYILTVKSSGLLARQEYELLLTSDEYNDLCNKVEGNIITKTRYNIPLSAIHNKPEVSKLKSSNSAGIDTEKLLLELDIFENKFKGLIMGEIEFPDKETADKYVMSDIFSKEVTYDTRFHNSRMSEMKADEITSFISSL